MSYGQPTISILDVHFDHLSHVFSHLSPLDLYHLALTCSKLRDFVYEFCSVKSSKLDTKGILTKFLSENRVLKEEKLILEKKITETLQPIESYVYALLYTNHYRVSILDVDFFPHAGGHYIPERLDEELGRNIYYLSNVCWLEIKHIFKNVKPDTYIAKIRMQLTNDFHWPGRNGSKIKFKLHVKEEDEFVEKSIAVFDTSKWINLPTVLQATSDPVNPGRSRSRFNVIRRSLNAIRRRRNDDVRHNVEISDECEVMGFDKRTGWFDLVLTEPIHITMETDVRLQYVDIENPYWKSGVSWDYIELVPKFVMNSEN